MEYEYPLYKRWINESDGQFVVRFDSLETGEVIETFKDATWNVGEKSENWIPHTATEEWEDYSIKPKELKIYKVKEYNDSN